MEAADNVILTTTYYVSGIILGIPSAIGLFVAFRRWLTNRRLVREAIVGRKATSFSPGLPSMQERFVSLEQSVGTVKSHLTEQDEHLTNQDQRLRKIEAEFRTNGGTSLRDDVVKMRWQLEKLANAHDIERKHAAD